MQIKTGQNGMYVLSQGDLAESQHMAVESREARPCAWNEEVGLAKNRGERSGMFDSILKSRAMDRIRIFVTTFPIPGTDSNLQRNPHSS